VLATAIILTVVLQIPGVQSVLVRLLPWRKAPQEH
jgi:hypothetical protein